MKKIRIITLTYLTTIIASFLFFPDYLLSRGSDIQDYFLYSITHLHWMHLLSNTLFIFFIGWNLEPLIGSLRFVVLILCTTILGALAFTITSSGQAVGASAMVMGGMTFFTLTWPERFIKIFYFFPVKTKHFFLGLICFDIIMYAKMGPSSAIAHSAHIGGSLAGYILYYIIQDMERRKVRKLSRKYLDNLQKLYGIKE